MYQFTISLSIDTWLFIVTVAVVSTMAALMTASFLGMFYTKIICFFVNWSNLLSNSSTNLPKYVYLNIKYFVLAINYN